MRHHMNNPKKPTVISLFSCAMGMDLGFEQAGFKIAYTMDINPAACKTIRRNRPWIVCDNENVTNVRGSEILKKSNLTNNDIDVIIGGAPCQPFSTAGKRNGINDERGKALLEFIRIIKELKPKVFVFENVSGIQSASKKHMSFYERRKMKKHMVGDEYKPGSLFVEILQKFSIKDYNIDWKILNTADYGVPQKRKRFILIGSRIIDPRSIMNDLSYEAKWGNPKNDNSMEKIPWRTLADALQGLSDPLKEGASFPSSWRKYLKYVPPGGCWVNLPEKIKKKAMMGAMDSNDPLRKGRQGGRTGFFRRLEWNAPAPTLVTHPSNRSTCLCHPDEDRPLTVKEYARIQGFPDDWEFEGTRSQKYRMIGDAVPIPFAKILASSILSHLNKNN